MMCEYTYSLAPTHCSELLVFMDEQRKAEDENLCDVRFIVGDSCVYAHRSVLAVCSAYFQGLLSGAFSESQGEGGTSSRMMEIDFTGSVSNIAHLDTLLSAAYTGSLKLSSENITGVTELACFLLVERVRAVCENFLLETLAIQTCLHYLKLAYRYDLTHLFKASRQLLQSRFHDHFIYRPDMMTITASCLELLPKIYKYVHLQDIVQFLVHWVEAEVDVREASNTREERIKAACSILSTHCHSLGLEHLNVSESSLSGSSEVIGQLLGQCAQHWRHPLTGSNFSGCGAVIKSGIAESHQGRQEAVAERSPDQGSSEAGDQGSKKCHGDYSHQTGRSSWHTVHHTRSSPAGEAAGCLPDSDEVVTSCYKDEVTSCQNKDENFKGLYKGESISSQHKSVPSSCYETSSSSHGVDKSSRSCHDFDKLGSSNPDKPYTIHDGSSGSSSYQVAKGQSSISHDELSSSNSQESGQKRELGSSDQTLENSKKKRTEEPQSRISDPETDTCDVLVAFAPGKKAVKYFTATDCAKNRPRYCALEFEVCIYSIQQRQWLWAGSVVFPEKFEDRDAWRVACVNAKAYFLRYRKSFQRFETSFPDVTRNYSRFQHNAGRSDHP